LINVSLKFTLSERILLLLPVFRATGLINLLSCFHPNWCLFLLVKWVSCRQQIVESSFLIQFANRCLLMGEFSLLAFSVSIDRYVVIPVM
jgi:hypothetical protein